MDKFQNKYRIPSARAQWWDYANAGVYFITICTAGRERVLGEIKNQEMVLSEIGEMVRQEWDKSFEIRRELFCDAFVIMPNHIHAILRIEKNGNDDSGAPDATDAIVETHGRASLPGRGRPPSPKSTPNPGVAYRPPKSISSFVAGFKSAATKRINEFRHTPKLPVWQSRFHDHIIRNAGEYQRIKKYISENPMNWEKDTFFREKT